jgi:hypothetical protein
MVYLVLTMADLNTVIEEKRPILPRRSILINTSGINAGITNNRHNSVPRPHTSSYRFGYDRRSIRYENTYRMEPNDEHEIDVIRVRRIATNVIDTAIAGYKYDPKHAKQFSGSLAERVRNQMKQLPYSRYKIVVQVSISQKNHQDLLIASQCVWDFRWDRHITITKETLDAYVTATIFYIYTE